jgi:hypothetical protein
MADTHKTNHSVVTPAEAVRELFNRVPQPGKDLVWLADELISIVQHIGSISLELVREETNSSSLLCSCSSPDSALKLDGRGAPYLFRPLLARLAVLGSEETATEFQPYGGRYSLTRSSRSGPVRLDIDFINTTTTQRLTISRISLPIAHPMSSTISTGSFDATQQHSDS